MQPDYHSAQNALDPQLCALAFQQVCPLPYLVVAITVFLSHPITIYLVVPNDGVSGHFAIDVEVVPFAADLEPLVRYHYEHQQPIGHESVRVKQAKTGGNHLPPAFALPFPQDGSVLLNQHEYRLFFSLRHPHQLYIRP